MKTPGAADAVIDSTKSKHANIANREKISTDRTVRKTASCDQPIHLFYFMNYF